LQIHQEEREDIQRQQSEIVELQGKVQMMVDDNKAKNNMHEQNLKGQQEILKSTIDNQNSAV